MDLSAELRTDVPAEQLFAWVEDLETYPRWLGIVERVQRCTDGADGPGGAEPAWTVDLRARVGPFSRAKRLRMVRREHEEPSRVSFERVELDRREHGAWLLEAEVGEIASGSQLAMHLHYSGRFWGPVLERLLADEVERSRLRLAELAAAGRPGAAGAAGEGAR